MDQNFILSGLADLLRKKYLSDFIEFLREHCCLDRNILDLIQSSIELNSFSKLDEQISETTEQEEINLFEYLIKWIFHNRIREAIQLLIKNNYDTDYMNHYAIITCAKKGYLDTMKLLFEYGADIHINNEMPLRISAQMNDFAMARFILSDNTNLDKVKNDSYTLETIINQENYEMLKLLYGTNTDPTVIQYAIEIDNADLMNFIIQNLPIINYDKLFLQTVKKNATSCILYLVNQISQKAKNKAFFICCKLGYENIARILIKHKININYDNESSLKIAIQNGHLGIVKLLVENHSNIHINNDEPLALACGNNHPEIIEYLVRKGANIYSRDFHVMKSCIINKHFKIVDLLVSRYKISA